MTVTNDKPISIAEIVSEYRTRSISVAIYRMVPSWIKGRYQVYVIGTDNQFTVVV